MAKPYIELPDILDLLPSQETTAVPGSTTINTPTGLLNEITNDGKTIPRGDIVLVDNFYDDASLFPSLIVYYEESFSVKLRDNFLESKGITNGQESDRFFWTIKKDGQEIFSRGGNTNFTFNFANSTDQNLNILGVFEIGGYFLREGRRPGLDIRHDFTSIEVSAIPQPSPRTSNGPVGEPVYTPFVAKITAVDGNTIEIDKSFSEIEELIVPKEGSRTVEEQYNNWIISNKFGDRKDLNTYIHFGDDKKYLITNVKYDNQTIPRLPYSILYKTYEPLPQGVSEKDFVYVVREILPPLTETVELIGYAQEDENFQVLIPRENLPKESPIINRRTELQSFDDLVTDDSRLKEDISDKFLGDKTIELSIDYSNYENFVNFSSAKKRLENFETKLKDIEKQTALSASFVGVTNGEGDKKIHHDNIRNIKNNFDGYENYLFNTKSTYISSSIGIFNDASWPKTGSGTYEDPFKPVSSSDPQFTAWYGSIPDQSGQLFSASFYDQENGNRLVNLLPEHVRDDLGNAEFLDFMDMIGQQFDEIWTYIKGMADITDRRLDLQDGFSKDLIFDLAKSLGWTNQDGNDLLSLSRYGFGRKIGEDGFSLYTSGSLSSPNEADISKEVTKRLIASMPYILKTKGTKASLEAILNCYGIPSTILKIQEYGGLDQKVQRAPFETKRRFTKALGFRGSQFVSSSWTDDSVTNRKPETIELRFKAVSGSDQVLIQKDDNWAIKLKDNGQSDNLGTVSFVLSGSTGHKEVSSSLLPVFDGDFYSLMLKKEKVELELFKHPSFETSSLFNPPFIVGTDSAEFGNLKIVSSSGVARTGNKSLEHRNTSKDQISFTLGFRTGSQQASVTNATQGETFVFSAFGKASGSTVDSVGKLRIFELDDDENVVNWEEDVESSQVSLTSLGGIKSSAQIGLTENEWKEITVEKKIRFPQTSKLGIRLENLKPESTIYWDDVSLKRKKSNTDTITDGFRYQLFVKKFSSGLDKIIQSANTTLFISGSNTASASYNASWTGSGDLFIGGKNSSVFGNQLTGSLMEFRLWNEPLKEKFFDNHVGDPKSYVGNTPSSSYDSLVVRYSFDDNTALSDGDTIRDVSSNQTTTISGVAQGFGGLNTFQSVVDQTKTFIPNYGPNRRSSDKIRIEDNFLSGSGASLSATERFDFSSNDFSPIDSAKVGIFFSPTDVVNDDIISSFANLDFNQLLGDPRDTFRLEYRDLKDSANKYFQKYTGNNDFWDYMHLIKFYDQSIFKQFRKLLPMRAKPLLGTVIEPNIFERSKNPVQRNNPSFEDIQYESKINVTNFHFNTDEDGVNQEASHSILKIETDFPNFDGEIDSSDNFRKPSLYSFGVNDNFDDRNLYISSSVTEGGPDKIFSEPTGAMIIEQKLSENNMQYNYFYDSEENYNNSSIYSSDPFINLFSSRSLVDSDLDPEYQNVLSFNRMFYEGVKNTSDTTIDGDLPFIVTQTAPTVAVPTTKGTSKLSIDQKGKRKKIRPRKRKPRNRR